MSPHRPREYLDRHNRWEIFGQRKGGMGTVYVVHDHDRNRVFAAKTFTNRGVQRHLADSQLFANEVRAWIALDPHPHIVRAHWVEHIEGEAGKPCLFMDYVAGGTLRSEIDDKAMAGDTARAIRHGLELCSALIYAHDMGIAAHLDVKPSNCLISVEGHIQLSDFGLSRYGSEDAVSRQLRGTPEYMAPEQWINDAALTEKTDVYAVGVLLFEMLTGNLPFGSRREIPADTIATRHRSEQPELSAVGDSTLRDLVGECMHKSPEQRPRIRDVFRCLNQVRKSSGDEAVVLPEVGQSVSAGAVNDRAVSLGRVGLHDAEIEEYMTALRMTPLNPSLWANLATALYQVHRLDEALACAQRATGLHPYSEQAWHITGCILDDKRHFTEAVASFRKAMALNADYVPAWYGLAITQERMGEPELAIETYRCLLRLDPGHDMAMNNLGDLLDDKGSLLEALEWFERAIQQNPALEQAWFNRGIVLRKKGRHEEALDSFRKAEALNPGDHRNRREIRTTEQVLAEFGDLEGRA